ncbi:hypothetical protein LOTGIDRAFT_154130 [Lottia gigantea]|uniref:Saposin B-type domain-containing protein n=1 Tax=Lottia gigantea TaxID=225164 RepID=V3ZD70_LOTGI|nr:hypothetical protein LOTGIDRAFT_154130 [Lottia gigantea]ESO89053.1 hypothetical protein LOTGIDRAFT_154130 [Lottia gigantea]
MFRVIILAICVVFATGSPVISLESLEDEVSCKLCLTFIENLHDSLLNQDKQIQVTHHLLSMCNELPKDEKSQCQDIVHGASPETMDIMATQMKPQELCGHLGVCSAREEVKESPRVLKPVQSKQPGAGGACELCEFVVQAVDQYIEQNKSEAAINATLYKICNKLPDIIKSTCLGFIPDLVQVLAQGLDPKEACTKIHLCTGYLIDQNKKTKEEVSKKSTAGGACELCEFVVQAVDQYIEQNKSEAAINATLYKICNKLPDIIKSTCLGFIPDLVQVLAQGLDPKEACTKIHLCTGYLIDQNKKTKEEVSKKSTAGGACELCEFVVQAVDQYIEQNKSEAAINATLYKICNKLPDIIKSTCLGFIPDLVQVLAQGLDPKEACTKIHLCTGTTSNERKVENEIKNLELQANPECDVCKFVVQILDSVIGENKTEKSVNSTLFKICNSLPDDIKKMCYSIAPNLAKVLTEEFDPIRACVAIKLCEDPNKPVVEAPSLLKPKATEVKYTQNQAGGACELCEFVVQAVDQYIEQNKSEAAINATLYKICNKLPDIIKSTVINYILQTLYKICNKLPDIIKSTCLGFIPELVQVLAQGLDPKEACTKIHLCSGNLNVHNHHEDSLKTNPIKGGGCDLCQFVVQTIDQFVRENKSEAAINSTLYKICNKLPDPLKTTCLTFAPNLVKVLAEGLDPKEACTKIHLCDVDYKKWCSPDCEEKSESEIVQPQPLVSKKGFTLKEEPKEKENGAGCELCKLIVQEVDTYVKDNKSEAAINATLYKVCNSLPASFKLLCLTYIPELEKALKNGLDPEKACEEIHVCKNNTFLRLVRRSVNLSFNEVKCDLCKDIVSSIDTDVYKDEDVVKTAVDDICNRFPEPVKDECRQAVDPNWKNLWNDVFKNIAAPENLCHLLTLCKTK